MKLRSQSPTAPLPVRPRSAGYLDDEDELEFQAFIESISLTSEELATLVARPELSVADVKRLFQRKH